MGETVTETAETAQGETVKQQGETVTETAETENLKRRIVELQEQGNSYSQISEKLGVSKSKIARVLKGLKKNNG